MKPDCFEYTQKEKTDFDETLHGNRVKLLILKSNFSFISKKNLLIYLEEPETNY